MSDSSAHQNLVKSHPVAAIHTSVPRCVYQAVTDYSPHHDGELSIQAGDIVSAVRPLGNGWSLGRNDSSSSLLHSGQPVVGIFPSHCIVPLATPPSQTMPSLPTASTTTCHPKQSQREFHTDCGVARNAFGDTVSQHQHCPECVRSNGGGGGPVAASGTRVQFRRPNDVLDGGRNLASPSLVTRDHSYPDCCANTTATSPKTRCEVSFVSVHRCTGSTGVAGTGCASCDDVIQSNGESIHRGPPDARHPADVPEACNQVGCRSAGGRPDRSVCDDSIQQVVSGTPVEGATSSSPPPPSVAPRRPVPQPPKPHLIVKPTRDPTSATTDSPFLSMTVDDRRHQQHEAAHQPHQHRCETDTHHRRNAAAATAAENHDDSEEVQPAWCGWRTSGRDRRRSANPNSGGDRRSFPPPPPPTSATARDGECRLSTFLGQSDPNVRESLSQAMSPSHRHLYGGESDADNEQSLRRPSNSRYKHRQKRGCRHDQDIDPSVLFRRINGSSSVPELSFGLSPTRVAGPLHLRSPMSGISSSGGGGGGKTALSSRTPRTCETTSGRSGMTGHRSRGSQFATCWCRVAGSALVALASGALTFCVMTFDLAYSLLAAAVCTALVVVLVGAALMSSNFCRCVASLVPSSLSTARGRTALCLVAAHLLLGGPVVNVTLNAGEAVRALTCSAELALNRTAGLMRPFDAMMKELDRTVSRLEGAAADVSRGLRPLDEGLDAVEMDVHNARTQLLGTRRTCKNLVDRAFVACDSGILKAQSQCLGVMGALGTVYNHARDVLDRINPERWAKQQQQLHDSTRRKRQLAPGLLPLLPGGSAIDYSVPSSLGSLRVEDVPLDRLPADTSNICEPLSSTLVCRGLNDSDQLCQPARWAGEAIQEAINGTRVAMRGLEDALRFRVTSSPYDAARSNANTSISVHHGYVQFQRYAGYFITVVTAVRYILPALIAVILIYDAFRYARSYLCAGDSFDNIYVEQAFVTLDRRRHDATGNRLLPLRKHERRHLIDATTARMSTPESRLLISGLCVVALCLACSVACCAFDYALYLVIDTADDSAGLEFDQSREPIQTLQRHGVFNGDYRLADTDGGSYINEQDSSSVHHHQLQRRHRRFGSTTSRRPGQPALPPHLDESSSTERVVTGDGVVVDLLEVFVRGFRTSSEEASSSSISVENARTAVCIPVARQPSGAVLLALGVLHLLFTATVALKCYAYRLRPSIAGYFYVERSMERAVHLYSLLVRRRRRLPLILRRLAFVGRCRLLQASASDDGGVAIGGRCAALLRRCDASDARCVVCWDRECRGLLGCTHCRARSPKQSTAGKPMSSVSPPGGLGGKYRYCSCGAVYCAECFVDVGRSCPLCRHDNAGPSNDEDETDDCEEIDECFSFDDDLNDVTYYDVSRRTLTHRWAEL